jgi:hypothetical protein
MQHLLKKTPKKEDDEASDSHAENQSESEPRNKRKGEDLKDQKRKKKK